MVCPICGGTIIGRIGLNQYYCWDCFIEFSINNGRVQAYRVEADGTLVSLLEEEKQLQNIGHKLTALKSEVMTVG